MSLSQIRNRINALRRKYALPLAVYRLRPLAEEFSQQWAVAEAGRKPTPESQPFIRFRQPGRTRGMDALRPGRPA